MCRQISTIGIGVIFIIGGLSGNLVLRGTGSGLLLALVGLILVIYGLWRIAAVSKAVRASETSRPGAAAAQAQSVSASQRQVASITSAVPTTVAPQRFSINFPDARGLSTNDKALLLLKTLKNRKQELAKDANSVMVEEADRYLINFPVDEPELQQIQRALDLRKEKMIGAGEDAAKIAEAEYLIGLLQEFATMKFKRIASKSF